MNRKRRLPPIHTSLPWLTLAFCVAPTILFAQTVVLDQGAFTVFLAGEEVGTETFAIRRNGNGAEATIMANGVVTVEGTLGPTQMRPVLQTAANRAPLAYHNRLEGEDVSEVTVTSRGQHFIAVIRSSEGERERELRAREGTVILDQNVAHHYYFIASRTERVGGVIPVVEPRTGRQLQLQISAVDQVELTIAGAPIQSRRVRLDSGGQVRDVWFDDQGRVLQVDIAALGYRAVRQRL